MTQCNEIIPHPKLYGHTEHVYERQVEFNEIAELNLVFNRHADGEDAMASVAKIPSESVVFIEGADTSTEGGQLDEMLIRFAVAHRLYGTESDQYAACKKEVLEAFEMINTVQNLVSGHEPDSGLQDHTLTEITQLLQKDCIVLFADYSKSRHDADDRYGAAGSIDEFLISRPSSGLSSVKFAQACVDALRNDAYANIFREGAAVAEVVARTGMIKDLDEKSAKPLFRDKKMPTYLIYGAAHLQSLSEAFASSGIQAKTTELLMDIPDDRMLPEPSREKVFSAPRIARYALFHSGILKFLPNPSEATKNVHEKMLPRTHEQLNEGGELLKFVNLCSDARRAVDQFDNEKDSSQLEAILTTFEANYLENS